MGSGDGNTDRIGHHHAKQLGILHLPKPQLLSALVFKVIGLDGSAAYHQISFAGEQIATLRERNLRARLNELLHSGTRRRVRAGDDGAGVDQHTGQARHAAAADSDKMNSLAVKTTGRTRIHSRWGNLRHHAERHRTPLVGVNKDRTKVFSAQSSPCTNGAAFFSSALRYDLR